MTTLNSAIKNIVILGENYQSLMAAAFLKSRLRQFDLNVSLYQFDGHDSSKVGYGLPTMHTFHEEFGLSEAIFLNDVQAVKVFALQCNGFNKEGYCDYFTCNESPKGFGGLTFLQWFLLFSQKGVSSSLVDFLFPSRILDIPDSEKGKLGLPSGYIFDCVSYEKFLKSRCVLLGVDLKDAGFPARSVSAEAELSQLSPETVNEAELILDFRSRARESEMEEKRSIRLQGISKSVMVHDQHQGGSEISLSVDGFEVCQRKCYAGRVQQSKYIKDHLDTYISAEWFRRPWQGRVLRLGRGSSCFPETIFEDNYLLQSQLVELARIWPSQNTLGATSQVFNAFFEDTIENILEINLGVLLPIMSDAIIKQYSVLKKFEYRKKLFEYSGKVATYDHDLFSEFVWGSLLWCLGSRPQNVDAMSLAKSSSDISAAFKRYSKSLGE